MKSRSIIIVFACFGCLLSLAIGLYVGSATTQVDEGTIIEGRLKNCLSFAAAAVDVLDDESSGGLPREAIEAYGEPTPDCRDPKVGLPDWVYEMLTTARQQALDRIEADSP